MIVARPARMVDVEHHFDKTPRDLWDALDAVQPDDRHLVAVASRDFVHPARYDGIAAQPGELFDDLNVPIAVEPCMRINLNLQILTSIPFFSDAPGPTESDQRVIHQCHVQTHVAGQQPVNPVRFGVAGHLFADADAEKVVAAGGTDSRIERAVQVGVGVTGNSQLISLRP